MEISVQASSLSSIFDLPKTQAGRIASRHQMPSLILTTLLSTQPIIDHAMAKYSLPRKLTTYFYDMNTTLYTASFQKANNTSLGVAHDSEIPFVFDTVPAVETATSAQKQLGGYLSVSWAAFASSGNVSHGALTLPDRKE